MGIEPVVLVVMGVSGSGKTTLARAIVAGTGWRFQEGDALHPPANVAKMASGTPLTDDDRWPWLLAIAAVIDAWREEGVSGVVTCSALKRAYREILVGDRQDVRLVYLRDGHDMIAARLQARRGHFMPAALLDSQIAALEEPGEDECPIVLDIAVPPEELAAQVLAQLAVFAGRPATT